MMAMQLHGV